MKTIDRILKEADEYRNRIKLSNTNYSIADHYEAGAISERNKTIDEAVGILRKSGLNNAQSDLLIIQLAALKVKQ